MSELSYCAELVRRHDHDRFLCALFAPAEEREALFALYAFNLEVARVRESVREPLLARMRLQWWRELIEGIYAGAAPREPVGAALAAAIARFDLACEPFARILAGREFDCDDHPPATLAELVDYAAATSSPLVGLSADILGARGDGVERAAHHLGIAWALTGLIRAVPFHARAKRLYLPAALNREAGLDVFAMFERGPAPGLSNVVTAVADSARDHLVKARGERAGVPVAALPAFLPASLAEYHLKRIARAGDNPFDPRVQAAGPGRHIGLLLSRLRRRY